MASLNVTHCIFHFTSTITFNLFLFVTRFVNIQLHLVSQEHVIVIKPTAVFGCERDGLFEANI